MSKVVIIVEDGVVNDVYCDEPCNYVLVDKDTDEVSEIDLTEPNGEELIADIGSYEAECRPDAVEHYFKQADLVRGE